MFIKLCMYYILFYIYYAPVALRSWQMIQEIKGENVSADNT